MQGQKGSKLEGTLTEDMLESSEAVLQGYRGRGLRGLQQFFTPPEAAKLIRAVFGDVPVVDLTAGDGSLIRRFSQRQRYGIEIDPDQAKAGQYNAIVGDLQKVYPLLRAAGAEFRAIAINPPFGLMWADEAGERVNSTVLCYRWALNLLGYDGQGVLIAGRDRFHRQIPQENVYAVVECPNLFEDADIPCVLAFFTKRAADDVLTLESSRTDLMQHAAAIRIKRVNLAYVSMVRKLMEAETERLDDIWKVLREEYMARYSRPTERKHSLDVSNGKIKVHLTPYQQLALQERYMLRSLQLLNNQSVSYFALNRQEWRQLVELRDEGVLTFSPEFDEETAAVLKEAEKQTCPLYPIKPQQRLGFLEDVSEIECAQGDPERGFVAGERYPIRTRTRVVESRYSESRLDKKGDMEEVEKLKEWRMMEISITSDRSHTFNETDEDIQYLIDHFNIPDPGDIFTRFPDQVRKMLGVLDQIESEHDWIFRKFQRDDLARLLVKRGGLLSWEQGLGKTLGGLAFTVAANRLGAKDRALFIVPQDLIPQWRREARRFFGRELTRISNIMDARQAREHLWNGGTGWYITYYEALSRNGRRFELMPEVTSETPNPRAGKERYDYETRQSYIEPDYITQSSTEFCPCCGEQAQHGQWDPKRGICRKCDYRHIKLKVKPAYSYLTTCFKGGVVIMDEGTKIKSNSSLMSLSVRGIRAHWKLLLTGTPIKNYIPDAFWLLWWSLGNANVRFPFDYQGGYTKFSKSFAVSEHTLDNVGRRRSSRVLPEVANLSILWRLLCGSIVRRRKEETGEAIVEKKLVPVVCPVGQKQTKFYETWLSGFASYFCETHPDASISAYPALVERNAAILGQLWKLEFSSVMPEAEPTGYYSDVAEPDNWTPANLKVLELAKEHASQGDKVLIGSSLMAYGKWIAERLQEKGILAMHIVEKTKNGLHTKSPAKRAKAVEIFQSDHGSILCASIYSMKLGHNLDTANVIILRGLPWDFSTYDQFIARVHRLTSTRPVTIYVVLADGLVDIRKWELLNQKGASTELALDGSLFARNEKPVDLQEVLDDLKQRGVDVSGKVDEGTIKQQWYGLVEQEAQKTWEVPDMEDATQLTLF